MGKMHQLLAVESDLEGKYKRICEETKKAFAKPALFTGYHRKLELFVDDDGMTYPEEHHDMTTTVKKRLEYTGGPIKEYFDALYQKEATNQVAKADLVVDGKVIGEQLPATFLLALESRLKYVRQVYEHAPTLQAGIAWRKSEDKGSDVWEMVHPEEKLKTKLTFKSQVLVEPTEHHPAQIEKWEEQEPVGKFVKYVWSGALTSEDKSQALERIDKLIRAVKQARQKANNVEVVKGNIGQAIVGYINGF